MLDFVLFLALETLIMPTGDGFLTQVSTSLYSASLTFLELKLNDDPATTKIIIQNKDTPCRVLAKSSGVY